MKKIRWGTLIAYIILAIFAIITVFPFIYMILGGLMSFRETTTIPPTIIPKHFEWSNYAKVFAQAPFARYFLNTFMRRTPPPYLWEVLRHVGRAAAQPRYHPTRLHG